MEGRKERRNRVRLEKGKKGEPTSKVGGREE